MSKLLMGLGVLGVAGCAAMGSRSALRDTALAEKTPPIGQFVTLEDGRQVHAFVTGEGPDLVLIHGASGNVRDFTFSFVEKVSDRYRVIVFDRPGLGYTDRANDRVTGAFNSAAETPFEQAAMLSEAAAKLGVYRPIVLGHSYGGAVAMAWGLEHDPAALVVVSGATIPWSGGLGAQYEVLGSSVGGAIVPLIARPFATRTRIENVAEEIFKPQPIPEGYLDYVGTNLTLELGAIRANARQVNNLHAAVSEMALRYPSVRMPVEVVHGAEDTVVPPQVHAEPLTSLLPEGRLTLLDGIGHMPHHWAPDAVSEAIDRAAARAGLR
ncbi:Lipase 3 precursor [Roseivivax sp. THAF40]|uniref:alpha/beta fold hydrolase n=1 Tax=unclassified Roseivivax TaxID=2639302 RepID=UPI0012693EA8|nr:MULTISPECIES: alpha/beta hydrolase [unclassified Roseivivax]QFS83175.1 Lipase 3 precursor [Roseivivax sp. THAF197b]QFT46919.1 Lipase 3 precursor [Roseivivax sp. THAF40]